ncbi:MAG: hypothetical protein COV31_02070 [Candidatus Yanofskybacteria bacterium CG10_big_fil_rev_8_21_14_0_10_46_23]|uniref:Uncharacterized protein n=1 Tax=Candidatus Yanofskybacteria bacterium CG10_big_fil_rev_8_21_14_0_10_46_23 TaxID=1975098 RepID=A0A2H0R5T6_9BACT|nr:MAG: hypothetical protein COV31_02070 [Candidatus Yanofskybacteria bacterium CG10_big_fil_rev_8_21_14_0_10_46_23]
MSFKTMFSETEPEYKGRQKRACAKYLGISPNRISETKVNVDGGGHFTGLEVIISIYTGREVREFVDEYCPIEKTKP